MSYLQEQYKDQNVWGRSPYIFELGEDFSTVAEMIKYILDNDEEKGIVKPALGDWSTYISEVTPEIYMRPNQSDTSLGGNDAINCYPQFCRNDDIIHPLTAINAKQGDPDAGINPLNGLGRVYSETYDKNQQILYLTFGVPKFRDLLGFYSDIFDGELATAVHDGGVTASKFIGRLLGKAVGTAAIVVVAFKFPIVPLLYAVKKVADAIDTHHVTRYYDFQAAMPMYYRYVNSILSHLAVSMGLVPNGPGGQTDGQFNMTYQEMYANSEDVEGSAIPTVLRDGPDIYRILSKRDKYLRADNSYLLGDPDDYLIGDRREEDTGFFGTFTERINSSMHGADKFVGFKIEKNVDSSESVSNTTGESSVQQMLNSRSASGKDMMFSLANGKLTNIPGVSAITETITSFIKGATDTIGIVKSVESVMTGSGMIDIPEVWQSSSFSKSYSFNMTFRATAGDPVSIFQDCYVPLAMLLAAALPRSTGTNSFTQPFVLRAYSKGQFAVPLGMISSMTITRGSSEFGWSNSMLPTVINVSFTIQDLAPCMHMALMDASPNIFKIFTQNSSFQEYLMTLSGIGLNERLLWFRNVQRKLEISLRIARTTYANPLFHATNFGNSSIARLFGAISPWSRYGNK